MGIEFRILGPIGLVASGAPVPLSAAKHRTLLAALLVRANEVVPSDLLVDALWPERAPATAGRLLHVYISQLRKALTEPRIATVAPGYVLRVGDGELDAQRFESLLEEGRVALASRERSARDLAARTARWRCGEARRSPTSPTRNSPARRRRGSTSSASSRRRSSSQPRWRPAAMAQHLPGCSPLVAQHPLRERPRAQLMLALYRDGRQADAPRGLPGGRATSAPR